MNSVRSVRAAAGSESEGGGFALAVLVDPFKANVKPEEYFKAAGEWLGITALIAWIVTYKFNFALLVNNPLRERVGYNNVCVAWDAPPTLYVIVPFATVYSYLGLRYSWTNIARTSLLSDRLSYFQFVFSIVADVIYGLCVCCFPMILVVTPAVSPMGHACIFQAIVCGFILVFWAHWMENFRNVTASSWIYLAAFTVLSIVGSILAIVSFIVYDQRVAEGISKPDPYVNPWLMMTVDYTWNVLLAVASKFFPKSEYIFFHEVSAGYMDSPAAETIGEQAASSDVKSHV